MKIALAPDLHCFYNTYGKLNDEGKNSREIEWDMLADELVKACVEKGVKVFVAPGDFFTNSRPTAEQVLKVSKLFSNLEKNKIKVIGIAGNHDIGGVNLKCMNDVVSAIGDNSNWCYTQFGTIKIGDVGFAFLPFVKTPQINAYNPDFANVEVSEQLIQIAYGLRASLENDEKIKTKILIGHWSIQGAVASSGRTMSGNEVVLPINSLLAQNWDACLFGHIHKPQVLSEKPFIAYSGAMQRINIGEANDERGFWVYDTKAKKDNYEFVNLPAIEMHSFNKDIATKTDIKQLLSEIEDSEIENKIVQVKFTIGKENLDLIDKKKILETLEAKKPMSIIGIFPHILDTSRQRDASITENLDTETALKKWMENKNYPEDTMDKVTKLLAKIQEEMKGE